jgi:gamma-glutamylcyclotransferase (GGCT)/AIG2-like uncharacterized protein YtfP
MDKATRFGIGIGMTGLSREKDGGTTALWVVENQSKEIVAMKKVYLAYGSNLNLERMGRRCPDAAVIGSTTLRDYRLLFRGDRHSGVATIERKRGSSVPVLLWEITEKCEKSLDRYEGHPHLYRKKRLAVNLDGDELFAMAYVMNEGPPLAMPDVHYYTTILEGYRDCGFDENVLKQAVMESMGAGDD